MPDPASLNFLLLWTAPFLLVAGGLMLGLQRRELLYPSTLVFFLFLGMHILFLSITLPAGEDEPGPGFVPMFLSVFLIVSCLLELLQHFKSPQECSSEMSSPGAFRLVLLLLLSVSYLIAIDRAGFFVSTAGFLLASGILLGARSLWKGLAVTTGWLIVVYLLFVRVLQITLPEGAFF